MPRLPTEAGVQEGANQLTGEFDADDSAAEHQHIHVVMLNTLVRRIGVVTQSGANTWNPVCSHRGANTASAEQDTALRPVLAQCSTNGFRIVGIVYRVGAIGAHIDDVAMFCNQENLDRLLQRKSGM